MLLNLLLIATSKKFSLFPIQRFKKMQKVLTWGAAQVAGRNLLLKKVGFLNCIDPSHLALDQARLNLVDTVNCSLECAGVDNNSNIDNKV